MTALYLHEDAKELLAGKTLVVIGDSVERSVYKDLVCLLQENRYLTDAELRKKGEMSFFGDELIYGGCKAEQKNSINYRECRYFKSDFDACCRYYFVTICYGDYVEEILQELSLEPTDIIVMNSCLWDVHRHGKKGIDNYEENLEKLVLALRRLMPECIFLWLTTPPVAIQSRGGFLTNPGSENVKIQEVKYCNEIAREVFTAANNIYGTFKVVDLDYVFQYFEHHRASDGVHWNERAHRRMSNMILEEISKVFNMKVPRVLDDHGVRPEREYFPPQTRNPWADDDRNEFWSNERNPGHNGWDFEDNQHGMPRMRLPGQGYPFIPRNIPRPINFGPPCAPGPSFDPRAIRLPLNDLDDLGHARHQVESLAENRKRKRGSVGDDSEKPPEKQYRFGVPSYNSNAAATKRKAEEASNQPVKKMKIEEVDGKLKKLVDLGDGVTIHLPLNGREMEAYVKEQAEIGKKEEKAKADQLAEEQRNLEEKKKDEEKKKRVAEEKESVDAGEWIVMDEVGETDEEKRAVAEQKVVPEENIKSTVTGKNETVLKAKEVAAKPRKIFLTRQRKSIQKAKLEEIGEEKAMEDEENRGLTDSGQICEQHDEVATEDEAITCVIEDEKEATKPSKEQVDEERKPIDELPKATPLEEAMKNVSELPLVSSVPGNLDEKEKEKPNRKVLVPTRRSSRLSKSASKLLNLIKRPVQELLGKKSTSNEKKSESDAATSHAFDTIVTAADNYTTLVFTTCDVSVMTSTSTTVNTSQQLVDETVTTGEVATSSVSTDKTNAHVSEHVDIVCDARNPSLAPSAAVSSTVISSKDNIVSAKTILTPITSNVMSTTAQEVTPSLIQEVSPSLNQEVTSTLKPDVTSSLNQEVTPSPNQEVTPTPNQEVTPAPKQVVTSAPNQEVIPAPKQVVTSSPNQEVIPAPKQVVASAPNQEATPTPKPDLTPAPKQEAAPAPFVHIPQVRQVVPSPQVTCPPQNVALISKANFTRNNAVVTKTTFANKNSNVINSGEITVPEVCKKDSTSVSRTSLLPSPTTTTNNNRLPVVLTVSSDKSMSLDTRYAIAKIVAIEKTATGMVTSSISALGEKTSFTNKVSTASNTNSRIVSTSAVTSTTRGNMLPSPFANISMSECTKNISSVSVFSADIKGVSIANVVKNATSEQTVTSTKPASTPVPTEISLNSMTMDQTLLNVSPKKVNTLALLSMPSPFAKPKPKQQTAAPPKLPSVFDQIPPLKTSSYLTSITTVSTSPTRNANPRIPMFNTASKESRIPISSILPVPHTKDADNIYKPSHKLTPLVWKGTLSRDSVCNEKNKNIETKMDEDLLLSRDSVCNEKNENIEIKIDEDLLLSRDSVYNEKNENIEIKMDEDLLLDSTKVASSITTPVISDTVTNSESKVISTFDVSKEVQLETEAVKATLDNISCGAATTNNMDSHAYLTNNSQTYNFKEDRKKINSVPKGKHNFTPRSNDIASRSKSISEDMNEDLLLAETEGTDDLSDLDESILEDTSSLPTATSEQINYKWTGPIQSNIKLTASTTNQKHRKEISVFSLPNSQSAVVNEHRKPSQSSAYSTGTVPGLKTPESNINNLGALVTDIVVVSDTGEASTDKTTSPVKEKKKVKKYPNETKEEKRARRQLKREEKEKRRKEKEEKKKLLSNSTKTDESVEENNYNWNTPLQDNSQLTNSQSQRVRSATWAPSYYPTYDKDSKRSAELYERLAPPNYGQQQSYQQQDQKQEGQESQVYNRLPQQQQQCLTQQRLANPSQQGMQYPAPVGKQNTTSPNAQDATQAIQGTTIVGTQNVLQGMTKPLTSNPSQHTFPKPSLVTTHHPMTGGQPESVDYNQSLRLQNSLPQGVTQNSVESELPQTPNAVHPGLPTERNVAYTGQHTQQNAAYTVLPQQADMRTLQPKQTNVLNLKSQPSDVHPGKPIMPIVVSPEQPQQSAVQPVQRQPVASRITYQQATFTEPRLIENASQHRHQPSQQKGLLPKQKRTIPTSVQRIKTVNTPAVPRVPQKHIQTFAKHNQQHVEPPQPIQTISKSPASQKHLPQSSKTGRMISQPALAAQVISPYQHALQSHVYQQPHHLIQQQHSTVIAQQQLTSQQLLQQQQLIQQNAAAQSAGHKQLYIDEYGQTYTLEEETYIVGPSGQIQNISSAATAYMQQQQLQQQGVQLQQQGVQQQQYAMPSLLYSHQQQSGYL